MNNLKKRLHKIGNKKGFTLVELIVVIVIIGILAAVMIPKVGGFGDKAKSAGALTEAKQVATAADALFIEKNAIPGAEDVKKLAGVDGTVTITETGTSDGLIEFTYKTGNIKGLTFTVTRDKDGDFEVTGSEPTE